MIIVTHCHPECKYVLVIRHGDIVRRRVCLRPTVCSVSLGENYVFTRHEKCRNQSQNRFYKQQHSTDADDAVDFFSHKLTPFVAIRRCRQFLFTFTSFSFGNRAHNRMVSAHLHICIHLTFVPIQTIH